MTLTSKKHIHAVTLFLFLLLCLSGLKAQTNQSMFKKQYLELGMGAASNAGFVGEISFQGVLKNNWTGTLSYHNITMNPKNLPSDYQRGYTLIVIFPIPDSYPEQELKLYSLTAGKFFELGRKFWITTEAGVSIINANKFTFSHQAVHSDGFFGYTSSNYATQKEKITGAGAMLKADFTWAFCSFAGLNIGAFANINSIQSPVGGEIKLIIGRMNRSAKNK